MKGGRARLAIVAAGVLAGALGGCGKADMAAQRKTETWDRSPFLPQHAAVQSPVPGTLARDAAPTVAAQPPTITAALLERGHERYDIYCTPCHGLTGAGDGMIVQRGFPHPPAFTEDRLMGAKAQHFYDVITYGKGAMYAYAERVAPADRWAVAAYIRALQLSQRPTLASLSREDRARLDGGAPAGTSR